MTAKKTTGGHAERVVALPTPPPPPPPPTTDPSTSARILRSRSSNPPKSIPEVEMEDLVPGRVEPVTEMDVDAVSEH